MTDRHDDLVPDDQDQDKPSVDWEKSIVTTIAIGAGILVILALAMLVALALLGPSIGRVYSGGGPAI